MKKKHSFFLTKSSIFLALTIILFAILSILILKNPKECANSISCIKDLSGAYNQSETKGVFLGKEFSVPPIISKSDSELKVLGQSSASNKRIYVDLTNQKLYAYEGNNLIYNFFISSGKWGRTPTGDFNIWIKLRYTRMEGGSQSIGTYYNLPNVPYTMFFYNSEIPKSRGFSLHGTYWHNNFGYPMSHGCVNMRIEDAEKIYYWSNPAVSGNLTYATKDDVGTTITIYGTAPAE